MLNKPLVLITGCAGFLGRNLINELASKEVDVIGIDKAVEDGHDRKNTKIVKSDILSEKGISGIRRDLDKAGNKEIYLIHLMGITGTEECERDKVLAHEANVKSTEIVWKLAGDYGMKKVVFSSTALVYGTKYEDQIDEECPPFPENAYARTKLEAENYLIGNSVGSKTASVILRLSNVYGPGMNKNTVVSTILEQLGADYLKLREYKSVRDYMYVGDVISAFIAAIFSECRFKVYNVGSSAGYSVWDLARIIAAATDKEKVVSEMKLSEEVIEGGSRLVLCCDRIKSDLKWKPAYDLKSGIKRTINA